MRLTVSVKSIPGATTRDMFHHVKGCLEYTSPDFIILHHGANDLNSNSTSEQRYYIGFPGYITVLVASDF